MFYTILKAITNYQWGPNFTMADYIIKEGYSYIYMTVQSFSSIYGISIYADRVDVELLKELEQNYKQELSPIVDPLKLCVIFSLLKICRTELYDELFRTGKNEYNIDYLKSHLGELTPEMLSDSDIYLAIFALMDVPEEGGTLTIGGREVSLVYNEGDLELMPDNIDWAYMGRGLWVKMCEIIAESKK